MFKFLIGILVIASIAFAGDLKPNGMAQGDVYTLLKNVVQTQLYCPMASAALSQASSPNSANLLTATTINYANNGILYSLASSSNIDFSGTTTKQTYANLPTAYYGVNVNASGIVYLNSQSNGAWQSTAIDGYTTIGYVKMELDSDNTVGFTSGTTDWDASSQNATYYNVYTPSSGRSKVKLTDL